MPPRARALAFFALAVIFAVAALFHLAAVARPALAPSAPAWRHAVFVVVNGACAVGLAWGRVRRARAFVAAFALLVVQQLWSHGLEAWGAARAGRVDLASLGVLAVMPLTLAMLVTARRA
jgi:hypothetical protein